MKSMKNSVMSFAGYHKDVIFFSILLVAYIYGVKIVSYNVGIDTDLWLSGSRFLNHMRIGRFGCVLLKSIWSAGKLNIYSANFCAALFLFMGAILWCCLFEYSKPLTRGGI